MMYPRNAASPERIAIGTVVQISDGAVQTTGVSVSVHPQGGSESAGGGTLAFNTAGEALYTPTQSETNHTSFIVTAYKTGCFPVSQTVVTTAISTPGQVAVGSVTQTAAQTVSFEVWDEVISPSRHNVKNSAAYKLWRHADTMIHTGVAQGPGSLGVHNQIQLDTGASSVDGAYDPALVVIVAGTGAGQSRNILQYVGATRMATVDRSWKVDPAADSEFIIVTDAGREHVNEGLAQGGGVQTIVLNSQASDHDDAYNAQVVFLRSGPGEDQARRILDYDGATHTALVSRTWATGHEPTSSTAYVVLPTGAISDNCIGRAVWSDTYGDYISVPNSAAAALSTAATGPTEHTLRESVFGFYFGVKDMNITGMSYNGLFDTGGYIEVYFQTDFANGKELAASMDDQKVVTLGAPTTHDAIIRFEAGNTAGGILTIAYTSRLDGGAKTHSFKIPKLIDFDECWNVLATGQMRPCDSGTFTMAAPMDVPKPDFFYCDGWSGAVNPVVEFSGNHGGAMDEATSMQYCVQYKTPNGDINMLGYWNTYSGWDQRMGENEVCPPGSILCFCADNSSPDPAADLMFIPGRTLVITPKTPGVDQTPKTLWVGEMTLAHQSGLKHCFGADGVMKDLNLITIPATQGGGEGVSPALIQSLVDAVGMLVSHTYHPGTIVNPVETQAGVDLTLYTSTDYDDMVFNVGVQWSTYLSEEGAAVWFTVKADPRSASLIDVQGQIVDVSEGVIHLDMTASQTNIKAGQYYWQLLLKRTIESEDVPPVITYKRRMMMEGKLYMKPSFKA